MTLQPDLLEKGRGRLKQIFTFIEALNELRNPVVESIEEQPWHLFLNELPEHLSVERGVIREDVSDEGDNAELDNPEAFVLKVARPELSSCPELPPKLDRWVKVGWEKFDASVQIVEVRHLPQNGHQIETKFDDDPERRKLFKEWQFQREQWKVAEAPAYAADRLFEKLYDLHGRIEREGERLDLLIGDGLLRWNRGATSIHHPLLLKRVQIRFDPQVPEFVFEETDHAPEFYGALFRADPNVDGNALRKCHEESDNGLVHPLGGKNTSDFFRRVANILSHRGTYSDDVPPRLSPDYPHIGRNAVLFMRTRNMGFSSVIQRILDDLKTRTDLPSSLLNIAGIEPPIKVAEVDQKKALMYANEDEEILFSKPANQEQLQIAQRLERYGCVLVQGPPGTGKSHTIGNLIGHLLAQGKSVLVTSHTTKALRVLSGHVVKELRPLCMSVLENDQKGQDELKSSVQAIAERLADADADTLSRQATMLRDQRRDILDKLCRLRQKLLTARTDEYREVVIDGEGIPPSSAARQVAEGDGKNDWIPAPVKAGAPLPLSATEIIDLYKTNNVVTADDESELSAMLPTLSDILIPEDFEKLIFDKEHLKTKDMKFRKELWAEGYPTSRTALRDLMTKLQDAVSGLDTQKSWQIRLIEIGNLAGVHREPWDNILEVAVKLNEDVARAQAVIFEHGPTLGADISLEEQETILGEIVEFTRTGKRLGWMTLLFRSRWKRVVRSTKVAGQSPESADHFSALKTAASIQIARKRFVERWQRMMQSIGASELTQFGETPEQDCVRYIQLIKNHLDWIARVWSPLEGELKKVGFLWDALLREVDPKSAGQSEPLRIKQTIDIKLPAIFESRIDLISWAWVQDSLKKQQRVTEACVGKDRTAAVVRNLIQALKDGDSQRYRDSYHRLNDLIHRRDALNQRNELLKRLETFAPTWAASIRNRCAPHNSTEPPGDSVQSWRWRQIHDELVERSKFRLEDIQKQLEDLGENSQRTTVELIDRLTWAAQVRRTSVAQRQALIGYSLTKRKIGKGTGKRERVLRLQSEARRLLGECRSAVPVWIMPLSRVVESFVPNRDRFDVVIIDEASQSDVMAMVALYFAKEVVIVGDHEQVSPEAVGQNQDEVTNLIDAHLKNIPNAALYDGKTSIYDLAHSSFGGLICLREHFRCVPEIIQFSNRLSYEGKIVPLRDESAVLLKPHVTSFRVSNASRSGDVNGEEAIAVVSLVVAASEEPEYAGKSFGVVSLLGEDQAIEIDRLLRKSLTPIEYEKRRIICGNPAQFQGDERDVMFLSIVDVPGDGPHPLRNDERFKKRFNVAASRAKDQMWVVYSLDPHIDLKADDLRRRIIEFGTNPRGYAKLIAEATEKTESEFEKQVFVRLTDRGFFVAPQFNVGAYRIDMVVKGANGRKLAIECDGDRYHPIEKLPDDMARQAILERLGWKFIRIRGSEFFRNPSQSMERVYARLNALGIEPGNEEQIQPSESDCHGTVSRVKARASELRDSWGSDSRAPSRRTDVAPPSATEREAKSVSKTPSSLIKASSIGDQADTFNLVSELPNIVATDAKMALRTAIEFVLQDSFRKCTVCRANARLYIGKKGPYMECSKCDERIIVPALIVQSALKRISAKCPECKGDMTAFDDGQGTALRCEDRGHRTRAEFLVIQ